MVVVSESWPVGRNHSPTWLSLRSQRQPSGSWKKAVSSLNSGIKQAAGKAQYTDFLHGMKSVASTQNQLPYRICTRTYALKCKSDALENELGSYMPTVPWQATKYVLSSCKVAPSQERYP
ncbi:hypothetical protein PoB_005260400 [Plakobranchus ocellatus]|uniref:Uncharacterized protein n=1 Tax=Plakobranchus ocellatus TaxID=259542 RepID=A0AAV4C5Z8_9GAST|nr:hypothetical protein PoB_005260400 [Plakobranchus ocellatus]